MGLPYGCFLILLLKAFVPQCRFRLLGQKGFRDRIEELRDSGIEELRDLGI
jgi:hypothetical protein